MPPPHQDLAGVQSLRRETLPHVVQSDRGNLKPGLLLEIAGDFIAQKVCIGLLLRLLLLVPDNDANFVGSGSRAERRQKGCCQQKAQMLAFHGSFSIRSASPRDQECREWSGSAATRAEH